MTAPNRAAPPRQENPSRTDVPPAADVLSGERRLLVVLAHPDDEAFGCTGVMAILRRRGVPVTYVCATMGQMGRLMGRPPFATRESLPVLRRRELAEAMRIAGVDDVRLLGLWDKTVEFEDPDALAQRIAAIIDDVRPSTLITFHPEHSGHPDHHAVGRATLAALDRSTVVPRPRVWMPAIRSDEVKLDLPIETVDISAVSQLKRAAFAAHRSQTTGWDERLAANEEMRTRFEWIFREERFWVWAPAGTGGS
ncbi:MAG TPA: bacillithiol biosynthesis deacetylase BshB2 [Bacillota bacterium]